MIPHNDLELLEKRIDEAENVSDLAVELPVKPKPYLPETTEELKDFILIKEEAINVYRAKVAVIKKLGLAQAVHQQALEDGQRMAEAVLWAKAKLGELLKTIPPARVKGSSTRKTSLRSLPVGITKRLSHHAQRVAKHQDLIPRVVANAIERGDIPSKKDMEIAIREVEKQKKPKAEDKPKSVSKISTSRDDSQTQESNGMQIVDPLHRRVIIKMNPNSTWLTDIKITGHRVSEWVKLCP